MMLGQKKDDWYAEGLQFECTQCGNCCTGAPGYVWLNDVESEAIAAHLGLSREAFHREYARTVHGRWTLNERWNHGVKGYDCVFLRRDEASGKAMCSVYSVRPIQCRTWPFWPQNLRSSRSWHRAAQTCPGMNQGNLIPVEQVRILRERTPDL